MIEETLRQNKEGVLQGAKCIIASRAGLSNGKPPALFRKETDHGSSSKNQKTVEFH